MNYDGLFLVIFGGERGTIVRGESNHLCSQQRRMGQLCRLMDARGCSGRPEPFFPSVVDKTSILSTNLGL